MEVIEVEGAEGLKITIGTPVAASRPWASAVAGLYCLKIQIKHFEILFYFFVFTLRCRISVESKQQYWWEKILKFNNRVGPNNHVGRNFSKSDKCVGLF